ncbi:uncharacterized protein LOC105779116 [Gossypium raimondii]|uniref:uncharacterized protein LOC105779116 n=1 Tax=Gossypium raimondii TaxID=29730 RepID=UPI00063A8FC4|nr:uncharacterized protein LOC105779116 [Gossypium raimondii]
MATDNFVQSTIPQFDGHLKGNLELHEKEDQGNVRAKRAQLQALHVEFETLRMKSGETVSDYFSRTMAITNKMRIYQDKLEDVAIVEKILRSMLPKFNFIICSIEESKDLDTLSIDELQNSLVVHEQKLIQQDNEEQALKQLPTRKMFELTKASGRVEISMKKYGYYHSECYTNLNKIRVEKSDFVEAIEKEEEIYLLMVCLAKEETNKDLWYLDTGCSNHMSEDKSAFSTLDESYRDTVKFGDCS